MKVRKGASGNPCVLLLTIVRTAYRGRSSLLSFILLLLLTLRLRHALFRLVLGTGFILVLPTLRLVLLGKLVRLILELVADTTWPNARVNSPGHTRAPCSLPSMPTIGPGRRRTYLAPA
jgi:hypothetical protein